MQKSTHKQIIARLSHQLFRNTLIQLKDCRARLEEAGPWGGRDITTARELVDLCKAFAADYEVKTIPAK